MENNYDKKIVEMLEKATQPMDIEKIRVDIGIGNWNTALKHCLELVISGKIKGTKTSKSWVFWMDKSVPNAFQEVPTKRFQQNE
jgi:hypothetical protein